MVEWVTTKEASEVRKVGLTSHRIAELARHKDIAARRFSKKWYVGVTFDDSKWELVPATAQPQNATEAITVTLPTLGKPSRGNRPEAERLAKELWPELFARIIDVTVTSDEPEPNTPPEIKARRHKGLT